MEIKRIEKRYINDLIELYNQLLPNAELVYNKKIDNLYNLVDKSDFYNILIGVEDEMAVSSCSLIIIPNITHSQRPYAIIENVITHKNYRKRGYGSELLKCAINIAKENNCHKVLLQTRRKEKSTLEFYRKVGFNDQITTGFMIDLEQD